jgi:hypothetical protein
MVMKRAMGRAARAMVTATRVVGSKESNGESNKSNGGGYEEDNSDGCKSNGNGNKEGDGNGSKSNGNGKEEGKGKSSKSNGDGNKESDRDQDVKIAADLPTHLRHGHAMPRLTGGTLMLGERGVMVAMCHGLCVYYFCVHGEMCGKKVSVSLDYA